MELALSRGGDGPCCVEVENDVVKILGCGGFVDGVLFFEGGELGSGLGLCRRGVESKRTFKVVVLLVGVGVFIHWIATFLDKNAGSFPAGEADVHAAVGFEKILLDDCIFLLVDELPGDVLLDLDIVAGEEEGVEEAEVDLLELESHLFFDEAGFFHFGLVVIEFAEFGIPAVAVVGDGHRGGYCVDHFPHVDGKTVEVLFLALTPAIYRPLVDDVALGVDAEAHDIGDVAEFDLLPLAAGGDGVGDLAEDLVVWVGGGVLFSK